MEKDTIITLEDNTMYALLEDTIIDNKKYFFAVKLDNKTKNPTTFYEIFESETEDGETYMNTLEDENLKQSIMIDFTNNYINSVNELIEESK